MHKSVIPGLLLLPKTKSKRAHLLIRRSKLFFFISVSWGFFQSQLSDPHLDSQVKLTWEVYPFLSLLWLTTTTNKWSTGHSRCKANGPANQGVSATPVHWSPSSAQKKCSEIRTWPHKFIQQCLLKPDEFFLKTNRQVNIYNYFSTDLQNICNGHAEHRTMAILWIGPAKIQVF